MWWEGKLYFTVFNVCVCCCEFVLVVVVTYLSCHVIDPFLSVRGGARFWCFPPGFADFFIRIISRTVPTVATNRGPWRRRPLVSRDRCHFSWVLRFGILVPSSSLREPTQEEVVSRFSLLRRSAVTKSTAAQYYTLPVTDLNSCSEITQLTQEAVRSSFNSKLRAASPANKGCHAC